MLKEIDEICRENDITYYLDSGTTLGAVRHHGFIPWDNDADVIMTEDNFYRFQEVVNRTTEKTGRTVQHARINPQYQAVFGKYIDLDAAKVTVQTPFWDEDKACAGMSIDIFCLLPLPDDEEESKELQTLLNVYVEFKLESRRYTSRVTDAQIEMYRKYEKLAEKIGKDKVIEQMEAKIFNRHPEKFSNWLYVTSPRRYPRVFPREFFDTEPKRLPFEDTYLPVSRYYLEEERMFYGNDWWVVPQGEEQRVHIDMQSEDISYRYYLRDFNRFFEDGELFEARKEYKYGRLNKDFKQREWVHRTGKLISYRVNKKIEERLAADNINLMEELDNKALLDDIFADYYRQQWNITLKDNFYLIELPEETWYAAIMNLLNNHEAYGKVSWVLQVYSEDHNGVLLPRFAEIQKFFDEWFEIQKNYYYERYEEGLKALETGRMDFPSSRQIEIETVKYEAALADRKSYSECEKHIDALLEKYPENTELIKAKGDLLWNTGNKEWAMSVYDGVYDKTNNGMARLDIEIKKGLKA